MTFKLGRNKIVVYPNAYTAYVYLYMCIYTSIVLFSFSPYKLQNSHQNLPTPPKFNIDPEKWWLEDYFPVGKVTFKGLC